MQPNASLIKKLTMHNGFSQKIVEQARLSSTSVVKLNHLLIKNEQIHYNISLCVSACVPAHRQHPTTVFHLEQSKPMHIEKWEVIEKNLFQKKK